MASRERNILASYGNWVANVVSPLVQVPLYLHFLGKQLYGEWLVILSLTGYLSLANLGVGQTVSNRVAEAKARGQEKEIGALVSTAFYAYALVVAVLLLVLFGTAPGLLNSSSRIGGEALAAFIVYFALAAAALPLKVYSMTLRGWGGVDIEQAIEAFFDIGQLAAVALILCFGFKLTAVSVMNGGLIVASGAVMGLICVRRSATAIPRWSKASWPQARALFHPSMGFFLLQISGTLGVGIDNLLIAYFCGAAKVTPYAVTFRLTTTGSGLFFVWLAALMPNLTVDYARGRHNELRKTFELASRGALLYAACLGLGLWLAGPTIVRLWAGSVAYPGDLTFGLQVLYCCIGIVYAPAYAIVIATSNHYRYALVSSAGVVMNLGLSLWWVQRWGPAGVMAATLAQCLIADSWCLPWAAGRAVGSSIGNHLVTLLPSLVLTAGAIAAAIAFSSVRESGLIHLALTVGALEAGILLMFGAIAFSKDERKGATVWFSGLRPKLSVRSAEAKI